MTPLIAVDRVTKRFGRTTALEDVSLTITPGRTLGLVGGSGSGKTTLGRIVARLLDPDQGRIVFDGVEIGDRRGRALGPVRAQIQMVFQDPQASLNPRATVGETLADPLGLAGVPRGERRDRIAALLARVGLPGFERRYPHELSGGQRQRVGIARALAMRPRLIIADEPVSALDVSIRGQILDLFLDLQASDGIAYLFVSHDLGVVRYMADEVAVMQAGRIVESGPAATIWRSPAHPYTRALIEAVPRLPSPSPG